MSRVLLTPKNNASLHIAVGIDPPFQCWFIQVMTEVTLHDDEEPKMLVDLDTSNRWKIIEVIDKYADIENKFVAKVREYITLDLDPGLLVEEYARLAPSRMRSGEPE